MATVVSKKDLSTTSSVGLNSTPFISPDLTSVVTHSVATPVIRQEQMDQDESHKPLLATAQTSSGKSFFQNGYVQTALAAGAFIAVGTTARVLLGNTTSTGALTFEPYGSPHSTIPVFDFSSGRRVVIDCPSYAYPNGATGVVTTGTNIAESVVIPGVTAWVSNPTTTPQIQIAVNNPDGTRALAPITVNVVGDGSVNFISGARFGNGNIGVCYGSYASGTTARMQFLVVSPTGAVLSKTSPLATTGMGVPEITCSPLANGNIQASILNPGGLIIAEVDSSGNAVAGTTTTITTPSGSPTRPTSFGQYPTGQKLWVLNDPKAGLQARVLSGSSVSYTSNLIYNGEAPDAAFDQSTVDTAGGPVTFWKTVEGNLHAGRVNPTNGKVTALAIDTSGLVVSAQAASNYDPSNPNRSGYIAVVINDGVTSSVKVLDANTLASIGCNAEVSMGSGEPSIGFYPDGKTLRVAGTDVANFRVEDFKLDEAPTLVSGPTGNQTAYSNSSSTTTYKYPVEGTDPAGYPVEVYFFGNNPRVSSDGTNIVVQVTPDMVGTSFDVEYTVENPFGMKASSNQTCTVSVPDRLPVVNDVVLPVATAGEYYSYELPKNTFGELDGQATTQFLSDLPQGLSYTPATPGVSGGLIYGWPLSQAADEMREAKTFPVGFSNEQTGNGLTTTRTFYLTVDPKGQANPPTPPKDKTSGLKGAYAWLTYGISAISVTGILGRLAISGRILKYQVPREWTAHKNDPAFCGMPLRRIGAVLNTCAHTIWDQKEARDRLKAQHGIELNWKGGLVASSSDAEAANTSHSDSPQKGTKMKSIGGTSINTESLLSGSDSGSTGDLVE